MNIPASMIQMLTPMIVNRIAATLGISPGLVTTAIGALVPSLLAALTGKASTPAGAAALSSALGAADPGIMGSLTNMLEGQAKAGLINNGTSALSSLLGGSAPSALAGAIAQFTGVDKTAGSGLVGMLAPIVLGSLAQTQKAQGLDAGSLANLLSEQKANIAAAIPPGFASLLSGTGLLDSVAGNLNPVPTAAPAAPRIAEAPRVSAPSLPSMPDAPAFNWMPWAIGLAGLLALYLLFGRPSMPPVAPQIEKSAAPSPVTVGLAEALKIGKDTVGSLTSTLGNIKDAATAQAAVPALTNASLSLDSLQKLAGVLPPDARAQITALVAGALPNLGPLVTNALSVPGADGILKPLLDAIMAKLTGLSKA